MARQEPLLVTVEEENDQFIACLYELDLYAYGDSISDALPALERVILDEWELLVEQTGEKRLGPAMLDKKRRLERLFRRVED